MLSDFIIESYGDSDYHNSKSISIWNYIFLQIFKMH